MKNCYNFFVIIILGLILFACSNNPLQQSNQSDDADAKDLSVNTSHDKYDFRKATWGMSKTEVMQTEEAKPVFESEYKINYETNMMGFDSKIGYTFSDDELVRASFLLLENPSTNNEYIDIYKSIQKRLKSKYGKTVIDTIQHRDPNQRIEPGLEGDAICDGDLLYATQWDTPTSDIQLLLHGNSSECSITIMYLSEEGFRQIIREGNNQ